MGIFNLELIFVKKCRPVNRGWLWVLSYQHMAFRDKYQTFSDGDKSEDWRQM